MNKKNTEGVMDLVKYVGLREQYDPLVSHARQVKTYQMRLIRDALLANERVVCATNGIAFITDD